MQNTKDIILREIDGLYRKFKRPVRFTANECQSKYGIDTNTYYGCIQNLCDSGKLIRTGHSELGANLFAIPDYTLPTQGKPNPQPSYKTTIKPFDFITLLETNTTMCNDGKVHPYCDIFHEVKRGCSAELGVKQYFNINPVTVTGSTFNDFMTTNTNIVGEPNSTYGKQYTTAYLLMWWQFVRNVTF